MSAANIHIRPNRKFDPPHKFYCPPDLDVSLSNGEAYFSYSTPLTAKTGAELRALADEADRVWAEYAATLPAEEVPA